ncbi:MAG TPA: GlsB/YeaQ/YmgE family stress response membrane protein [Chloroflexota bacterium]
MQLFAILVIVAILLMVWFSFVAVGLLIHMIPWIIIGLIAGAIASAVTGSRHGILGDIGLGLVGAVLGGFLMRVVFHWTARGFIEDIIVGVIGAVVILLIGKAISPRRRYY